MKKLLKSLSLILFLSFTLTSIAIAQEMKTKLLRGVTNTFTGWVEIPKNIYDISVEENIFVGITKGTTQGVGMAVVRTGCGIYEMMTFPFPLPEAYEPIMLPEYVIEHEKIGENTHEEI